MTSHTLSQLLSVSEAAALLNIQPDTLRHWLCDRRLPFVKVGGRTMLKRPDLEGFIEAQTIPAESPLPGILERRRQRHAPAGGA